jgi:hypothetical protein
MLHVRSYRHRVLLSQSEREQSLTRQVVQLTAENESLKRLCFPMAGRITNVRQALTALQRLDLPSQAAALVTAKNGPTLYWIAVRQFGVEPSIAQTIASQHPRDWPAALTALDRHIF